MEWLDNNDEEVNVTYISVLRNLLRDDLLAGIVVIFSLFTCTLIPFCMFIDIYSDVGHYLVDTSNYQHVYAINNNNNNHVGTTTSPTYNTDNYEKHFLTINGEYDQWGTHGIIPELANSSSFDW